MDKLIAPILAPFADRLVAYADTVLLPKLQEFFMTKVLPVILGRLTAAMPTLFAAALKAVFDKTPDLPNLPPVAEVATQIGKIIEADPDIPGISDIIDVSQIVTKWLHL